MIYARFISQASERTYMVLGFLDDEPTGAGLLSINGGAAEIGPVVVLEAAWGKGLGGLMVRMLIRKAYDLGYASQLALANVETAGFYKHLGFKALPALPDAQKNAGFIEMLHEGDVSGSCG